MQTPTRRDDALLTLAYVVALGVLSALMRAAPYYFTPSPEQAFLWNLMPIGALALFCGSRLRTPAAWLVPVGAMFVADLLLIYPVAQLGYSSFALLRTPLIYLSFAAYVALGRLIRPDVHSPLLIGGAALVGGVQFFVVTNFAVWLNGFRNPDQSFYPTTLAGLGECYVAAVPFYRNTVTSDLLFVALFFTGHAALVWLAQRRTPALTPVESSRWSAPSSERVNLRSDEVRR